MLVQNDSNCQSTRHGTRCNIRLQIAEEHVTDDHVLILANNK
jgi:hypothetical protein